MKFIGGLNDFRNIFIIFYTQFQRFENRGILPDLQIVVEIPELLCKDKSRCQYGE